MTRQTQWENTCAKFRLSKLIRLSAEYIKEVGVYIEQCDGRPEGEHFVEIDVILTLLHAETDNEFDRCFSDEPHHYVTVTLYNNDTFGVTLGKHYGCYWGECEQITETILCDDYETLTDECDDISEMLYNFLVTNIDDAEIFCFDEYEYFEVAYGTKNIEFDDQFSDSNKENSFLKENVPEVLLCIEDKLKTAQRDACSVFSQAVVNSCAMLV
jgi:hypothetical protein